MTKRNFWESFRSTDYYTSEREDLVRLVPESVQQVLDVGCAMGGYGKRLKQHYRDISIIGVELNPVMAKIAAQYYDNVYTSSVENVNFSSEFDLINCGEILEHLNDPWNILTRFYTILKEGGYLVISIPNIGHWSIIRDLLQGRFQYIPFGLLYVSHIRWFTEESIRKALEDAGFVIDLLRREQATPTPQGEQFITAICDTGYGNRESLMTYEFTIRAVKR